MLNDQFAVVHEPVMLIGFLGTLNRTQSGGGIGLRLVLWHPDIDRP